MKVHGFGGKLVFDRDKKLKGKQDAETILRALRTRIPLYTYDKLLRLMLKNSFDGKAYHRIVEGELADYIKELFAERGLE